jgi:diguanylate cyclase (GGDEF)-like protein
MNGNIRAYDAMGRYGGEEFLVVLPNCDESGALAQAERLRNSISETPILTIAGEIPVTCSLGLSWTARAQPQAHQGIASLGRHRAIRCQTKRT